ncbi:MAG: TetR/AcrR family transcriptional regulator [Candidatus Promineifilaceae bacterium]
MQQRSVETRQLLMEATIDCIREMGYHRASTNEIVRRAGLSRGAMLHHYPTKHDLLVAAFAWVHEEISADIETLFRDAQANNIHWIDLLDEIMARYFQGRSWEAFVEIIVAARTESALREQLRPIVRDYYDHIDRVWQTYFTTEIVGIDVANLINLSLCVVRGMAFQMLIRDDPLYYDDMMRQWKAMIAPLIKSNFTPSEESPQPHISSVSSGSIKM